MPYYKYRARDRDGKAVGGILVADSEDELEGRLAQSDRILVAAHSVSRDRTTGGQRIPRTEMLALTSQLAVIVGSGMPILDGLEDIASQATSPALKQTLDSLSTALKQGTSLSEAMAAMPRAFSPLYVNTVRSAEETGSLEGALERLISYLEWEQEIASRIKQAAAYPVILSLLLGSVLILLVTFVLPRFGAIFTRKGYQLPLPTRTLLWISSAVTGHWIEILIGSAALVVTARLVNRTRWGRHMTDSLRLRTPIIGTLMRKIAISRFAQTMATTVAAGLDITSSIRLGGASTGNSVFAGIAEDATERISGGGDIAMSLNETGVFPSLFVRMVGVGEKTGSLDIMLEKASRFYDREVKDGVARMMTICEAVVTVVMGVAVAAVSLSVFLPLYRMLAFIRR